MAKGKKTKKGKVQPASSKSDKNRMRDLKPWQQTLIAVAVIVLAAFVFLSDLTFEGLTPAGGDVLASKGKTNLMLEYEQKTGEVSLWNPAVFCGMPAYHRDKPRAWSLDTFASYFFSGSAGQVVVYYIIGSLGMFFLLYSLNFSTLISLFGALAFLLMSHYNSLWLAGHFSKFRAVMYIPWVVAAFSFFLNRRSVLGMLLFTLAFTLQIRTQHYQIIFYTALILFSIGIYPAVRLIIDKKITAFLKVLGLLIISIILTTLAVYQPLFVINEYTPYSTRGGNPVHIDPIDKSAEKAKGVSFEYATNWSLSPKEMICFIIPRYFGGSSQETYKGDAVPQLKGYTIPGYWGDMPFTGSTDYIGVALFILMVFGIYGYRKDWRIVSLGIFTIFALLLGFGKHFPAFYKLFFYHFPYFSKFRVPTMIMMAVFVVFVMFAAFGIRYLIDCYKRNDKKVFTMLYIIAGFLFILTMSPFVLKGSFSFTLPHEISQYNPQVMSLIKTARYDLMKMDALRSLFFSVLLLGLVFAYLKKYVPQTVFLLGLIGLMIVDVLLVNQRFFVNMVKKDEFESRHFAPSKVDQYLLSQQKQQTEPFRILGMGRLFSSNNLAYYHQCIGGYDPAKMQTIQDIIDNNLYRGWDAKFPVNWNVINFLNGKYFISENPLNNENLKLVAVDESRKLQLYENLSALPRAFLVGQYQRINDPVNLLRTLNDQSFNPGATALLEKELPVQIQPPDSTSFARIVSFASNSITLEAKTSHTCLLVLSETFYPLGWLAYVDGQETEIYRTNHILRAIVLPQGEHKITFDFFPTTYYKGKWIATLANFLILLSIVILGGFQFRKFRKQK